MVDRGQMARWESVETALCQYLIMLALRAAFPTCSRLTWIAELGEFLHGDTDIEGFCWTRVLLDETLSRHKSTGK
jgi:hypothetical protein